MVETSATRTGKQPLVTGYFRNRDKAEQAYEALGGHGYTRDDINVMMSDDHANDVYHGEVVVESDTETKAMEGAGVGGAIGGAIGGAAGAIVGAIAAVGTTLALPGLGLLVAGPLAAGLAGAGAGGFTGGLVGGLIGFGIPEEHAVVYDRGLREGGVVLGVHPRTDEDAQHIASTLNDYDAERIYQY